MWTGDGRLEAGPLRGAAQQVQGAHASQKQVQGKVGHLENARGAGDMRAWANVVHPGVLLS